MLKLNTALTALAAVLMALLCFLGARIWDDVAQTKAAMISSGVQMQYINRELDDHQRRLDDQDKHLELQDQRLGGHDRDILSLQRENGFQPLRSPHQNP